MLLLLIKKPDFKATVRLLSEWYFKAMQAGQHELETQAVGDEEISFPFIS